MLSKELTGACSIPIILGILSRGESYGYQIIQDLKSHTDGDLEWADGMLYPILRRMEQQGSLESYWQKPENGRKRRYYRITKQGQSALETEKNKWRSANLLLEKIWDAPSKSNSPTTA